MVLRTMQRKTRYKHEYLCNDKADDVELYIHASDSMMDETIDRVIDVL